MKVVVITGSTRGIGLGLAKCFLAEGHHVVITGTSATSLDNARSKLKEYDPQTLYQICNVINREDVKNLIEKAHEKYGKIDIFINNAGINHNQNLILDMKDEEIKRVIDINVYGVIHSSTEALQYMLKQGFGAIYNMEGLGSEGRIAPKVAYYGMSKRMVRYYTRAMAKEYKDSGILICRLSPGMVVTDLLKHDIDKDTKMTIFNILADKVEDVTPYLTKKILSNTKNNRLIAWLTTPKIIWRFMTSRITKRNPFEDYHLMKRFVKKS